MKRLRQVFKISLAKIFFTSNYVICLVIFDWDKFFRYLNTPAKIDCHLPPPHTGGTIDFSVYGMFAYNSGVGEDFIYPILMLFLFLFAIILFILIFPSIIITQITLEVLKNAFPLWCLETHNIIYIPILAVINSFYWVSLAYFIELAHAKYLQIKPPAKKPLSIFPD